MSVESSTPQPPDAELLRLCDAVDAAQDAYDIGAPSADFPELRDLSAAVDAAWQAFEEACTPTVVRGLIERLKAREEQ